LSGIGTAPLTVRPGRSAASAGAIDDRACRLRLRGRQLLHPRQLALEFIGKRDDRVEAHHLDGAGSLVHVRARMFECGGIGRIRAEEGDRLQPALQRLVDFSLHPGQRAQIEYQRGIGRHGTLRLSL
jgi:hypothetical protein